MPKISRQTREIINVVLFLLVVATLFTTYIFYPLGRAKVYFGRSDIDEYHPDSLEFNQAPLFVEAGLNIDTFYVESDGMTKLACLYVRPDSATTIPGTVFLLHDDGADRDSLLGLTQLLSGSGYIVVLYDQRAGGLSTGKYHGEGQYESSDLQSLISHLDIRGGIVHPLTVVGYGIGADAAIMAAVDENRIDAVVAIRPHLSTTRLLDKLKDRHDSYWFPFFRTVIWWWYDMRSGYAMPYRESDHVRAVGSPTVLILPMEDQESEEIRLLKERSDQNLLRSSFETATNERIVRTVDSLTGRL